MGKAAKERRDQELRARNGELNKSAESEAYKKTLLYRVECSTLYKSVEAFFEEHAKRLSFIEEARQEISFRTLFWLSMWLSGFVIAVIAGVGIVYAIFTTFVALYYKGAYDRAIERERSEAGNR